MRKIATRKLEETSCLAQTIADMMEVERAKNGAYGRWCVLQTFKLAVNCADTGEWGMYYDNDSRTNHRLIIIPTIPFSKQNEFLGLANATQDAQGYTVNCFVTHDLNSATIDVSRLMDVIRLGR